MITFVGLRAKACSYVIDDSSEDGTKNSSEDGSEDGTKSKRYKRWQ